MEPSTTTLAPITSTNEAKASMSTASSTASTTSDSPSKSPLWRLPPDVLTNLQPSYWTRRSSHGPPDGGPAGAVPPAGFVLGVRVSAPVQATGRVKPGQLPGVKVARTVYSGPYEGLPSAWGEFNRWMKANGHEQAENLWEVYSVGPQSSPDPANWRTELNRPLAN